MRTVRRFMEDLGSVDEETRKFNEPAIRHMYSPDLKSGGGSLWCRRLSFRRRSKIGRVWIPPSISLFRSYFVEAGTIAVRHVRKEDLRHVAKATGATAVSTFVDLEREETFDSSLLGTTDEEVEEPIADDDVIMIKGTKTNNAKCRSH